jgi:hypothetical protein
MHAPRRALACLQLLLCPCRLALFLPRTFFRAWTRTRTRKRTNPIPRRLPPLRPRPRTQTHHLIPPRPLRSRLPPALAALSLSLPPRTITLRDLPLLSLGGGLDGNGAGGRVEVADVLALLVFLV